MITRYDPCICPGKTCEMSTAPMIVIRGVDKDSLEVFRPRDWASILLGLVSLTSPCGRQISPRCVSERYDADGTKGLRMSAELAHGAPDIYEQVLNFAVSNNLQIAAEGCPTLLHQAEQAASPEFGMDEY